MRTRSAANSGARAQSAIDAMPAASDATPTMEEAETTQPGDSTRTVNNPSAGLKRKRQTRARPKKKRTAPVKKEWVLPHGMGAALGPSNEPTSSEPLLSVSAPPGDLPDSPTSAKQDGVAVSEPSKPRTQVGQGQEGTHVELGITEAAAPEEDLPAVEEKQTADDTTSDAEQPPVKVQRITRTRKTKVSVGVKQENDDGQSHVQVKTEETTLEQKTITASTRVRKLIIFRNVSFKSSAAVKHSDLSKVLIDATQILDPNKRMVIKRGPENPYGLTPGFSPYPHRQVPTPDDCEEVHRILTEAHADTASKLRASRPEVIPDASLDVAGCGEVPCVLDALLRTLISGNTLMARANAAIKRLGEHYGTRTTGTGAGSINWEKARLSSREELTEVIKTAGNGPNRSKHIKAILDMVYKENLERGNTLDLLSLDHMRFLTKDQAMAKFVTFPGIGIKTAACVCLFCLRLPCFAVDTHVHKFCRWLGWTPAKADPDNCYRHGDARVPDHLKYGLHNLFIVHGQECFKCRKITKPGTKDWNEAPECPLEHLLDRSKDESKSEEKGPKKRGVKKEEDGDDDDSDVDMEDAAEKKPKKAMRNKTKAKKKAKDDDGETEEAAGSDLEMKKKPKRPARRATKANKEAKGSDFEITQKPKRSARKKAGAEKEVKSEGEIKIEGSDVEMEDASENKAVDDDETEDEIVVEETGKEEA
ncbi:hypothetical protein QBC44DRAFT_126844 [Cladorrhinum sp. PSN332]|nr:hypothetical protein QBC44DRAFT_126844 [Cladorrhinum sp. PSN332]